MSEVTKGIFGGTSSGTPQETRGLTSSLAGIYGQDIAGGANPFSRMTQGALQNILGAGFSPSVLGQGYNTALNWTPDKEVAALNASLDPLEQQASDIAGQGVRSSLGALGGRFSTNELNAEGLARGQVAQQYGNIRANTNLQGSLATQQNQQQLLSALSSLLLGAGQLGTQQLGQIAGFAAPGAPVVQPGIIPGLASSAGQIGIIKGLSPGLLTGGRTPATYGPTG